MFWASDEPWDWREKREEKRAAYWLENDLPASTREKKSAGKGRENSAAARASLQIQRALSLSSPSVSVALVTNRVKIKNTEMKR